MEQQNVEDSRRNQKKASRNAIENQGFTQISQNISQFQNEHVQNNQNQDHSMQKHSMTLTNAVNRSGETINVQSASVSYPNQNLQNFINSNQSQQFQNLIQNNGMISDNVLHNLSQQQYDQLMSQENINTMMNNKRSDRMPDSQMNDPQYNGETFGNYYTEMQGSRVIRDNQNVAKQIYINQVSAQNSSIKFNSNDTNVLQKKLLELQAELNDLDFEYDQLIQDNKQMQEQNQKIKAQNIKIFEKITNHQEYLQNNSLLKNLNIQAGNFDSQNHLIGEQYGGIQASLMESFGTSAADLAAKGTLAGTDSSIGEIHSLYQDLFLTDIKQEVEKAQTDLKNCKQEHNTAQRDIVRLRRENAGLGATLKRYRQMLQEMTNQKKNGPFQKHSINMLDNLGYGRQNQQSKASVGMSIGKTGRMNRSESGSSIVSSIAANANQIDQVKIERLLTLFNLIQKNDNIINIVMLTIRELKSLIHSQSVVMFIIAEEYSQGVQDIELISNGMLFYQKFMLESGKMVDAVSNMPGGVKTAMTNPDDIKYGFKDSQYMIHPILNKEEEIKIVIQCESKLNKNKKFQGFHIADEQVLKIICFFLQMRLERRNALKEVKKKEQQVVDTLKLTSEICTQRHHEGLFRKMREHLPSFFGFEAVGVLMYNYEQNYFFTDQDTSKDEKKESDDESSDSQENLIDQGRLDLQSKASLFNSQNKKKDKKKQIAQKTDVPLTEEQKTEKIRKIYAKNFMNFPTNSGISGAVFKSKELYFSNNASKETKFVEEIDNQSVSSEVKNFMIGPVFGTSKPNIPCAIIQFINKLEHGKNNLGKISQADELNFKQMQKLLGMCVENTNEMSSTIKVSFDVQDIMKVIQERMKEQNESEKQDESEQMIQELTEMLQTIGVNRQKLIDLRAEYKPKLAPFTNINGDPVEINPQHDNRYKSIN